jgi:integration host factor subunit beta
MNRSDLINELKNETLLSRKDAEKFVETFFDAISDTLMKNDRVEIRGFGSFTVKKYKPYVGRNPKTGTKINVPPKKLPFFKVGKELKEMVDNENEN